MGIEIQFAHINWYSEKGAKAQRDFNASYRSERGRGWSIADILAEATREHGHCGHVEYPQPPHFVVGSIATIEQAVDLWTESQAVKVTTKAGREVTRKMRSDSPSMAAGVISLPRDRLEAWPAFRDNAVAVLQEKHGDRLRCVIEHLDEKHPHLHFYLVPRPVEDFGVVHDGYRASREARKAPGNKIRMAYNDAMSKWQDWIQENIAAKFALARLGPGRVRLSRKAWKADEVRRLELREEAVHDKDVTVTKLLADVEGREMLLNKNRGYLNTMKAIDTVAMSEKKEKFETEKTKAMDQVNRLMRENESTRDKLARMYSTLTDAQRAHIVAQVPDFISVLAKSPADTRNAPKPR